MINVNIKVKDKFQRDAVEAWKKNQCVGSIIAATGVGKTRIGVLCAAHILKNTDSSKVIIVVPTRNLRDNEWTNEFTKWGYEDLLDKITITCVQSLYDKESEIDTDLLIVDEAHTTLSDEYSRIYKGKYKYLLCLTATVPEEVARRDILFSLAPKVFEVTIKEAIDTGLIAPYEMYNVPIKLTRKEMYMYDKFDHMFKRGKYELLAKAALDNNPMKSDLFEMARFYSKKENEEHDYHEAAKNFWQGMSMRKWVCYKAENKLDASIKLIQAYPEKKWIVFAKNIKFITKLYNKLQELNIGSVLFHSKLKNDERVQVLEEAKDDKIKVICSVDALNAGYDLPSIDAAISLAGTSTALPSTQRLGRILRLKEDKVGLFINLFAEDTQEEKWIEKRTKELECEYIDLENLLANSKRV